MPAVLLFTIFFGLLGQSVLSQTTYPVVPDADYAVYTAIANDFSKCSDIQYAYRQGNLLFIKSVTEEKSKYGFQFSFAKAEEQLSFLTRPQATFYKEPGWKTFIVSVDTSQFTKYEIKQPFKLTCRTSRMWSPDLQEYYFGNENHPNRGYYALRNDYPKFEDIVSLSKVAYSSDCQKALCYYSEVSDGKAGAGYLVFLERLEGTWKVIGSAGLWMA
ncbi:hypothetical protein [Spirosoma endophyticum]|uniref:Uncharacterized protein n=1 Tax=Spirosoma endophyticum TaxID=662367 RepID=A0A1I1RDI9_9BACT|nr:hypothetical protein [Spirosoma endophyticum]SFD32359.1 hypothetical protein SAMN05216167_104352 [Spirosoma endophyticum]